MIISASRRTDIPCHYSNWLENRIKAGFVRVRNSFNANQIKHIVLTPDQVDCFVFWTKDPKNMMHLLPMMDDLGYCYYFQFTLTPYDRNIECNLRDKFNIENTFLELSRRIGAKRIRWRYDPIILNETLTIDWHKREFSRLCEKLASYTANVSISFVDIYSKLKTPLIREISLGEMQALAGVFSEISASHSLPISACCEPVDLASWGIQPSHCIDGTLIKALCGHAIDEKQDKSQRPGCGCVASTDIGAYNTCINGCVYCYANRSQAEKTARRHHPENDMLI